MIRRGLDLYACQGGTWKGYTDAGFVMYGVEKDEKHRRYYPGPMHVGSALDVLVTLISGGAVDFTHRDGTVEWLHLSDFVFIHASPPCQHATAGTRAARKNGREYPELIEPTRELLEQTGLPWVIENVKGAALRDPIVELCGCMFDLVTEDDDGLPLRLERPRKFESSIPFRAPREHYHDPGVWVAGSYGGARKQGTTPTERRHNAKHVRHGGYVPSVAVQRRLLGIDWPTTQWALYQSIPPVYAEYVGRQLIAHLAAECDAWTADDVEAAIGRVERAGTPPPDDPVTEDPAIRYGSCSCGGCVL